MRIYKNNYCPSVPTNFVPLSHNNRCTNGIHIKYYADRWNIKYDASYYNSTLKDSEMFPVVGEIDLSQTIIQAILNGVTK